MNIPEIFGCNVFNDVVMRSTLPKEVYKSLRKTIDNGERIDMSIADSVANAMKDWATSKGATHYTHWFQPLTNLTAEKHDSFIEPVGNDEVIMQLTGRSLIVGEPDASSFPSGGSRETFAARGYTAWDPTSPAFVKEGTLYIPTIFVSYTGETLDKKAPLLKSMTAIDRETKRILKLFGIECAKVNTTVGPEQEYFLVDKKLYEQRKDLILTGRTLFGAPSCKGQEMDDHYFGALKPRVAAFMRDLDETLWRFGVLSKSKHNEAAPAQHEIAPIFSTMNVAVDSNQLTMDVMKKVALRHDMVCLLHEKPFAGINGSGKHNNWSLSTTGLNLLDPGPHPESNALFMLVLACIIKAVDKYQGLLRACIASAGNDHRLGGGEAPPAILSVYLGDELGAIVDSIVMGKDYVPKRVIKGSIGVPESPIFPIDSTDRNRTSPFAFTGNKFEFRMLGSSASVADPNIVLNSIVAEAFSEAADKLEKADDFEKACKAYTEKLFKRHARIIFNYNGYGPEWEAEAEKRGLLNHKNTADAVAECFKKENVDVFVRQGVYTKNEAIARAKIQLENYVKTICIEAKTMIEMATKQIYPSVNKYVGDLCRNLQAKKALFSSLPTTNEEELIKNLAFANEEMMTVVKRLTDDLKDLPKDERESANRIAHVVCPDMRLVRALADKMEMLCSKEYWPFPTYSELLFSI
ncbi:MAG: glutamine synthetase III [Clostridia bacterium]|nr:glutamine synthetase III [Clostridia bacterium]